MNKMIIFMEKMYAFLFNRRKQGNGNKENTLPVEKRGRTERNYAERGMETGDVLRAVEEFLERCYEFRFNKITETTEYRERNAPERSFAAVGQRELNSFCIVARKQGINCWDKDISRYVNSMYISPYHPFLSYMDTLPAWDRADRVEALARRVSEEAVWVNGFHRWMLGLAAQWMGKQTLHANSVAPVLISRKQGKHKSTFCKMLVPAVLQGYYTDSFDISSVTAAEQKLTTFGLINLDELDKYSLKKMALLKNLMQMAGLNVRKAYKKNYALLPRMASFIATSNQKELLTDPSGSRRFLCVEIHHKIDCSPIDHEQLYAQLKTELNDGARYWFTGEEESQIMQNNAAFQKRGMEEDVFLNCYRLPEPGDTPILLSGAHILGHLKKQNPAAMRGVNPVCFGKTLITLGAERIHTERGNLYRVVPVA
jgi:predicted P-loop ATPase